MALDLRYIWDGLANLNLDLHFLDILSSQKITVGVSRHVVPGSYKIKGVALDLRAQQQRYGF
jgi:hypothetical protein